MKIEAVVFDMDGLMLDSEKVYVATSQQAAADLGYTPSEELAIGVMGSTNEAWRAAVQGFYGEGFPLADFVVRCDVLMDRWYAQKGIPLKAGLIELLTYLNSEKIPCAVASSTATQKAMKMLRDGGVEKYFTGFVFGDTIERSKPAPDIFLAAAKLLGKEPSHCMGLEDSRNGLHAAKSAGMYTVMRPDLLVPDAELLALVDGCLPTLLDVIPLIKKLNEKGE
ncbi:MAG: HAD family phosphatase [Angelakisella sp.]